jgi:hypothetical protein
MSAKPRDAAKLNQIGAINLLIDRRKVLDTENGPLADWVGDRHGTMTLADLVDVTARCLASIEHRLAQ